MPQPPDIFEEYSKGLTANIRTLVLACFAVIWIVASETGNPFTIPSSLYTSGIFFAVSLGVDLLQYCGGTFGALWVTWEDDTNTRKQREGRFKIVMLICLVIKTVTALVGFLFMLFFLYNRFSYAEEIGQLTLHAQPNVMSHEPMLLLKQRALRAFADP